MAHGHSRNYTTLTDATGDFIWVYCKAVESASANAINARLLSEAIPRVIEWAKHIESLDVRSPIRREKQSVSFPFDEITS
jgi:hypothetical protein